MVFTLKVCGAKLQSPLSETLLVPELSELRPTQRTQGARA